MGKKAMTLRLDAAKAAELEALARIDAMPIAEIARIAINEHIERRRKDKDFQERRKRLIEENREILDRLA
jgi:hypothetical protein